MLQEALTVKVSSSLKAKLTQTAQEEGIDLDALVQELLAESVVLRAWEILERKSAMRGHGNNNGQHQNHRSHHGNRQGGPRRHQPGGNWMEDRAAFLEYVRNQEKAGR